MGTCETCAAFRPLNEYGGRCGLNPPVFTTFEEGPGWWQPAVALADGCMQWTLLPQGDVQLRARS